jgi:hypothetical protein
MARGAGMTGEVTRVSFRHKGEGQEAFCYRTEGGFEVTAFGKENLYSFFVSPMQNGIVDVLLVVVRCNESIANFSYFTNNCNTEKAVNKAIGIAKKKDAFPEGLAKAIEPIIEFMVEHITG